MKRDKRDIPMGRILRTGVWRGAIGGGLCVILLAGWVGFHFRTSPPSNLVLITLDTTRADRIGCYGYKPALTPHLDELASGGVLLEHAYTPIPVTLPAHTTMFTGLTPREHGVHHNGLGKLDSALPTLAEVLRSRGYATGAFVGAFVLNRKFGLNRGFDEYDDTTGAEFVENRIHRRRGARLVIDAALSWLDRRGTQPFFCWIHLFDPHGPYQAREDLFGDRFVENPYDAGIAAADREIGRFIESLKKRGTWERTLIVVVGDHGEGLGEHAEREHGMMLYNSTLQVPLILAHRTLCQSGHRVSEAVSLVDLPATLIECVAPTNSGKLPGHSFAAGLRGESVTERPCYGETDVPLIVNGWGPQRSLIDGHWKYIQSPRPELFDLSQDRAELHNLAHALPDKLRELDSMLADVENEFAPPARADGSLSSADRRALAALGYAQRSKSSRDEVSLRSLPDIKDRIRYHDALEVADKLIDQGRLQEALGSLRQIVADVPDFFAARMFLGETLAKTGKLADALAVFRDLAESEPERGEVRAKLGWILMQQGQHDGALAELQKALELAPDSAEYRLDLGQLFWESKRPDEARRMFDSAIALDPAAGHFGMGKILAAAGDNEGALTHYRLTLRHDPYWFPLHAEMSVLLADRRQFDEAIEHATRAAELGPNNADLHFNLGLMYARSGKPDWAIGPLKRALELNPDHAQAAKRLRQVEQALAQPDRQDPARERQQDR